VVLMIFAVFDDGRAIYFKDDEVADQSRK
jgi:hypothetical protein